MLIQPNNNINQNNFQSENLHKINISTFIVKIFASSCYSQKNKEKFILKGGLDSLFNMLLSNFVKVTMIFIIKIIYLFI